MIAKKKLEEVFIEFLKLTDPESVFARRKNNDRLIICDYDIDNQNVNYEINAKELFNG